MREFEDLYGQYVKILYKNNPPRAPPENQAKSFIPSIEGILVKDTDNFLFLDESIIRKSYDEVELNEKYVVSKDVVGTVGLGEPIKYLGITTEKNQGMYIQFDQMMKSNKHLSGFPIDLFIDFQQNHKDLDEQYEITSEFNMRRNSAFGTSKQAFKYYKIEKENILFDQKLIL